MSNFCVLGIDGGGSKTECAIVDNRGECLGTGRGGASNANYVSWEQALESITAAVRLADEAAGPDRPPVVAAGSFTFSARKFLSEEEMQMRAESLASMLANRFGDGIRIFNYLEGEIALGCIDVFDRVGIACIAGTGSSCFGLGRNGERILVGGWGSPLGDEGGGIYIATRALQAVGRAHDGRGPKTLLEGLAAKSFGETVDGYFLARLGKRISSERAEIASFAKLVSQAAEDGDDVARGILDDAADELADLVLSAARKLFSPDETFPVALHGSVFTNERVASRVSTSILKTYPSVRPVRSIHSPGVGAALLALHDIRA